MTAHAAVCLPASCDTGPSVLQVRYPSPIKQFRQLLAVLHPRLWLPAGEASLERRLLEITQLPLLSPVSLRRARLGGRLAAPTLSVALQVRVSRAEKELRRARGGGRLVALVHVDDRAVGVALGGGRFGIVCRTAPEEGLAQLLVVGHGGYESLYQMVAPFWVDGVEQRERVRQLGQGFALLLAGRLGMKLSHGRLDSLVEDSVAKNSLLARALTGWTGLGVHVFFVGPSRPGCALRPTRFRIIGGDATK